MDNGNVIRPLILEESANEAETLASTLRNAGYAVRFRHIEDAEDLQEALDSQSWDLLLSTQQVGDFTATQALSIIKQSGKDIPSIIFGGERTDALVIETIRAGAADFVADEPQDHLLLVIEQIGRAHV